MTVEKLGVIRMAEQFVVRNGRIASMLNVPGGSSTWTVERPPPAASVPRANVRWGRAGATAANLPLRSKSHHLGVGYATDDAARR